MDEQRTPKPPKRSRRQFGLGTLFVFITLAALVSWWLRQEMLDELRRREFVAKLEKQGNVQLEYQRAIPWRRRLAGFLAGGESSTWLSSAGLSAMCEPQTVREFQRLFPEAEIELQIAHEKATPELLDLLATGKIFCLNIAGSFDPSDANLARLAKIRSEMGVTFGLAKVDDETIRRVADAGITLDWIWDGEGTHLDSCGYLRLTDDGLREVARIKTWTRFEANRNASDEGVAAFRGHPALGELHLTGPSYSDASVATLITIPQLSALGLKDTQLTDEGLAQVIAAKRLRELRLVNFTIGPAATAALGNTKSLKTIEFRDVRLPLAAAVALAGHPLAAITLEGDYDDATVAVLAPVAPTLRSLKLNASHVGDAGLSWIAKAATLEGFHLYDSRATVATIRTLPNKSNLVRLSLAGKTLDASALAETREMVNLWDLQLAGENFDDQPLAQAGSPRMDLRLIDTRVTAEGLRNFIATMQIVRESWQKTELSVELPHLESTPPPLTPEELQSLNEAVAKRATVSVTPWPAEVMRRYAPHPGDETQP